MKKSTLELLIDIASTLILMDFVWTRIYGQKPPVEAISDFAAFLGTLAIGWLIWRLARRDKALG